MMISTALFGTCSEIVFKKRRCMGARLPVRRYHHIKQRLNVRNVRQFWKLRTTQIRRKNTVLAHGFLSQLFNKYVNNRHHFSHFSYRTPTVIQAPDGDETEDMSEFDKLENEVESTLFDFLSEFCLE